MSQKIADIPLKDLVLWTENPRDPIDSEAVDQAIVTKAVADPGFRWDLAKLAKEMGGYYDFSELPTVVYRQGRPVVYDGNRRIILGKLRHGLVSAANFEVKLPDIPSAVPCNVCSEDIALQNVYRKHAETGSWLPLERDIFLNKHMRQAKSAFLLVEENTGLITANPHLNQRFVKEEVFKPDALKRLGFTFKEGRLLSRHSTGDAFALLGDLSQKIRDKVISTRRNRGKVVEVLDPVYQQLVEQNKRESFRRVKRDGPTVVQSEAAKRRVRSRRTTAAAAELFGGPLFLRFGPVSNLYRDLNDLHAYYALNRSTLSETFPGLIRMGLRLLCEVAARDKSQDIQVYIKSRFDAAKGALNQDDKTTLSTQNVTETSLVQLLHVGAHSYTTASNVEQTYAISLVLGRLLTASHGREDGK